jgi:hypothetical protein
MNHGLFVPAFDALAAPALLAHLAAQAEAAGWYGMFLWDHLLHPDPVVEILDPWICLAAMAVATERWPNRAPLRRAASHDGVFAIQVGTPEALVRLRQVVTDAGARRDGFDVVVQGAPEDDPAPWEEAGATWWLTQLGPYHLELSEVGAVIQAGPRRG